MCHSGNPPRTRSPACRRRPLRRQLHSQSGKAGRRGLGRARQVRKQPRERGEQLWVDPGQSCELARIQPSAFQLITRGSGSDHRGQGQGVDASEHSFIRLHCEYSRKKGPHFSPTSCGQGRARYAGCARAVRNVQRFSSAVCSDRRPANRFLRGQRGAAIVPAVDGAPHQARRHKGICDAKPRHAGHSESEHRRSDANAGHRSADTATEKRDL